MVYPTISRCATRSMRSPRSFTRYFNAGQVFECQNSRVVPADAGRQIPHSKVEKGPNELEGYVPFKFRTDLSRNITLEDKSHPDDTKDKMTVQAARDHIKPGTALFATGRGRYRLIDLVDSETDSKDISLKVYRQHIFYPNTRFRELVDSFRKMWQKIFKGYSAEVHIVLNEAKTRGHFQHLIDASPHLHPEIILRAMPTGTTILVPPQANFSDVCWLMAPPPEKSQIPKEEFLILSHSERKSWAEHAGRR